VDAAPAYGLSEFARQVVREEISVVNLPAGYWHEWADAVVAGFATVPSTIRLVVVGSERLDPDRVARWQLEVGRHPVLLHAYGVSEATITSVVYRLDSGPVLLGRPLPGVDVAVTDRNGAVVPLGMPGELTLGGPGVALGYLDGSTASFCERDGQRWYRTGDRARWTPEGDLEFLGRLDRQLKIDGRRIEPAEIEAACMRDPRVVSAAVGLRNQRLIAVVTGTLDPDELLAGLRERLPPALVPAEAHVVPTLPRNAAGKVDVAALVRPAAGSTGPAPRTAGRLERQLREVWQEVLGVPDIGLDDSFFDVGGRSMSLVRAQSRLAGLGIEVAMIDLFRRPTIRTLAAHIAGRNQ
jgi:acyl-coenzyme A synthetase/AMP-(fatty) acid ligase